MAEFRRIATDCRNEFCGLNLFVSFVSFRIRFVVVWMRFSFFFNCCRILFGSLLVAVDGSRPLFRTTSVSLSLRPFFFFELDRRKRLKLDFFWIAAWDVASPIEASTVDRLSLGVSHSFSIAPFSFCGIDDLLSLDRMACKLSSFLLRSRKLADNDGSFRSDGMLSDYWTNVILIFFVVVTLCGRSFYLPCLMPVSLNYPNA